MPGSTFSAFSEGEELEAALGSEGCLSLVVTSRGAFRARLTQVALASMRLSGSEEQLSRIAFVRVPDDMGLICFSTGKGLSSIYGGIGLGGGEMMIIPPGQHTHVRTNGPCFLGAIWIPVVELYLYGSAMTGEPFTAPLSQQRWRSPRAADKHLRTLHAAVIRIGQTRPQTLADAQAAHGLEQQLIEGLVECLMIPSEEAGRRAADHQDTMVAFERLLQAEPHRDIRMTEISAALGISGRLLRTLCAKHLGMNGHRYIHLRRMSLVRKALRRAGRDAGSVAVVARSYGFSDLGRFAASYRTQFGELPSATLRRGSSRQIVYRNGGSVTAWRDSR